MNISIEDKKEINRIKQYMYNCGNPTPTQHSRETEKLNKLCEKYKTDALTLFKNA